MSGAADGNAPAFGHEMPLPAREDGARSVRLERRIRDDIAAAGGAVSFARFMELALYAPGLGYYAASDRQFGAGGDFVTAPELSPLFGRCLARPCGAVLEALGDRDVLELGPGSGALAAALLPALAERDRLPRRYLMLEVSAALRARQAETVAALDPAIGARVQWLERLPEDGFEGVILANEVADAVPCHRVRLSVDGVEEWYVVDGGASLAWGLGPPSGEDVTGAAAVARSLLDDAGTYPYDTEVAPARQGWLATLAERLAEGLILVVDYGYPAAEFYHPGRRGGTLACHYRHRVHHDPLRLVGLQDITSHVDFTALADAGAAAGLTVAGFTTQGQFLLDAGLLEEVTPRGGALTPADVERINQVKRLTLPGEMGEAFKVMALTRGLGQVLPGFGLKDLRQRL